MIFVIKSFPFKKLLLLFPKAPLIGRSIFFYVGNIEPINIDMEQKGRSFKELTTGKEKMINPLNSPEELNQIIESSHKRPLFLFKHSTACPVSASAWRNFNRFAEQEDKVDFWRVLVIENRQLSLDIADKTGIRHKSPQVILFGLGKPVWHESHWSITEKNLKEALDKYCMELRNCQNPDLP